MMQTETDRAQETNIFAVMRSDASLSLLLDEKGGHQKEVPGRHAGATSLKLKCTVLVSTKSSKIRRFLRSHSEATIHCADIA